MKAKQLIESAKYQELVSELRLYYPNCFVETSDRILKKGIRQDIIADAKLAVSVTLLRKVLQVYSLGPAYQKAHYPGAKRYNLEGEVVGEVTQAEVDSVSAAKERKKTRLQEAAKARKKQSSGRKNVPSAAGHQNKLRTEGQRAPGRKNQDNKNITKKTGNRESANNLNSLKPTLHLKFD